MNDKIYPPKKINYSPDYIVTETSIINVYSYNLAIEDAVKVADDLSKRHYTDETIADEIRKLKK